MPEFQRVLEDRLSLPRRFTSRITVLKMFSIIVCSAFLSAQEPKPAEPLDYVCPMDPEVRSAAPGECPRCGMKLILGVPDPLEYAVEVGMQPRTIRADQPVELTFSVTDPTGEPVQNFEIVHEKLFHLFVVSEDLAFFLHEHPEFGPDHRFRFETRFPRPGMYRVLCDFYPRSGTPQLLTRTLLIPGSPGMPFPLDAAKLTPDLTEKHSANLDVELVTEPATPIAGMKTRLLFRLKPADGIEPYLGAWGHMLAVSDDLLDVMHTHPFLADGGPRIQFNMIFPRARMYRVWVQFQRAGRVNTVAFNVPVAELTSLRL
jgi:hypothetical protein